MCDQGSCTGRVLRMAPSLECKAQGGAVSKFLIILSLCFGNEVRLVEHVRGLAPWPLHRPASCCLPASSGGLSPTASHPGRARPPSLSLSLSTRAVCVACVGDLGVGGLEWCVPCCVWGDNKEASISVCSGGNSAGLLPFPLKYQSHPGRKVAVPWDSPWVRVLGLWSGFFFFFLFLARAPHFHFSLGSPSYLARAVSRWFSWRALAR